VWLLPDEVADDVQAPHVHRLFDHLKIPPQSIGSESVTRKSQDDHVITLSGHTATQDEQLIILSEQDNSHAGQRVTVKSQDDHATSDDHLKSRGTAIGGPSDEQLVPIPDEEWETGSL
jgi:hypothetical protein